MKTDTWLFDSWIEEFSQFAQYVRKNYPRLWGKEIFARFIMLDLYGYSDTGLTIKQLNDIYAIRLKSDFERFRAKYSY
jgi:hypothetical protein